MADADPRADRARTAQFPRLHPDRLDLYLARQGTAGGWAYLTILLALLTSVAAVPLVEVPVSVTGRGVLRSALDSQILVAPVGGQVVYVIPRGERKVAAGETVLLLERPDLVARNRALAQRASTMEAEALDLERIIAWADGQRTNASPTTPRYRAELASAVHELHATIAGIRAAEREARRAAELYQRQLVSTADAAAAQDRVDRAREDSLLLRSRTAVRWREELAALNESMQSLRAERAALSQQLAQLVVQAPVAGWVDRITALSAGSRVVAGERIATLTPIAPLIAELYVDPRVVDGIRPGGRVRLQLQSRQYTRDGAMNGTVVEIAPLLVTAGEGAVALVRVAPEPTSPRRGGADPPLRRGSAVVGRLQIGKRTLWALIRGTREESDRSSPTAISQPPQPVD